jgi:hypothetical protein
MIINCEMRVFENRMLRTFGLREGTNTKEKKLHDEELHNLSS